MSVMLTTELELTEFIYEQYADNCVLERDVRDSVMFCSAININVCS